MTCTAEMEVSLFVRLMTVVVTKMGLEMTGMWLRSRPPSIPTTSAEVSRTLSRIHIPVDIWHARELKSIFRSSLNDSIQLIAHGSELADLFRVRNYQES